jgi:hypothetical protein
MNSASRWNAMMSPERALGESWEVMSGKFLAMYIPFGEAHST